MQSNLAYTYSLYSNNFLIIINDSCRICTPCIVDCPPFQSGEDSQMEIGNYMAVGSFNPAIEIWNLDVLDPLEPSATLGGIKDGELGGAAGKKKSSKRGKKSIPKMRPGSHTDAVMSLSWNKLYRQALASGSSDNLVKIWDVTTHKCSHTFAHHTDKVQSVLWHPVEGWLLSTGSFDKTISLLDCRTGNLTST